MEKFEYRINVTSDVQPSQPSGKDLFCTDWTADFRRFSEAFISLDKRFPESEGFLVRAVCRDAHLLQVDIDEAKEELGYD
jgi:hypothetical protein